MSTPHTNDYYPVKCPGCQRQQVIRLYPSETLVTPCTCKRVRCRVVWTTSGPELREEKTE